MSSLHSAGTASSDLSQTFGNEAHSSAAKFVRIQFLNSGSFGTVELAQNVQTGELVAIKYIERGSEISKYVEREILHHRLVSRHPHIIGFKEVFLTERHLAIVMQYAAGGNLFQYVAARRVLHQDSARWFFQQLMVGVDFCHRKGIANRDLKLENVLLESSDSLPVVKICDFGYAKDKDKDSQCRSVVGTPQYMAPEVVACRTYDGQLADIWSCGVILYVMVAGRYPFLSPADVGTSPQNLIKVMLPRMQAKQLEFPPDTPPPAPTSSRACWSRCLPTASP